MELLIVDDSKAVHALMKALFKGTSNNLLHAMNGQEAIELIENNKNIDLVLLDWEMPVLNGLETLKKIREQNTNIPVIMVTSKSSSSNIETIMNNGASEYIMKPFTKDILFDKIDDVLDM